MGPSHGAVEDAWRFSLEPAPKAVAAAAHQGQDYYEERYRQRLLHNLNQRANKLGMKLVSAEAA